VDPTEADIEVYLTAQFEAIARPPNCALPTEYSCHSVPEEMANTRTTIFDVKGDSDGNQPDPTVSSCDTPDATLKEAYLSDVFRPVRSSPIPVCWFLRIPVLPCGFQITKRGGDFTGRRKEV
jgi:hypothetical protein